jgi:predicted nucleic acid-binding protein
VTTPRFVDTNIFIRHIAGDHAEQSPAARALIEDIDQGRVIGWTTDVAIAEAVYVLGGSRFYRLDRSTIRCGLLPLINMPGLRLPGKALYRRVFDLYVALPIDFPDAFHAALIESRGEPELYSFDRDFDRIPTLKRIEPQRPSLPTTNGTH